MTTAIFPSSMVTSSDRARWFYLGPHAPLPALAKRIGPSHLASSLPSQVSRVVQFPGMEHMRLAPIHGGHGEGGLEQQCVQGGVRSLAGARVDGDKYTRAAPAAGQGAGTGTRVLQRRRRLTGRRDDGLRACCGDEKIRGTFHCLGESGRRYVGAVSSTAAIVMAVRCAPGSPPACGIGRPGSKDESVGEEPHAWSPVQPMCRLRALGWPEQPELRQLTKPGAPAPWPGRLGAGSVVLSDTCHSVPPCGGPSAAAGHWIGGRLTSALKLPEKLSYGYRELLPRFDQFTTNLH